MGYDIRRSHLLLRPLLWLEFLLEPNGAKQYFYASAFSQLIFSDHKCESCQIMVILFFQWVACTSLLVVIVSTLVFIISTMPAMQDDDEYIGQLLSVLQFWYIYKKTQKNQTLEGKNRTLGGMRVKNCQKSSDIIYGWSLKAQKFKCRKVKNIMLS